MIVSISIFLTLNNTNYVEMFEFYTFVINFHVQKRYSVGIIQLGPLYSYQFSVGHFCNFKVKKNTFLKLLILHKYQNIKDNLFRQILFYKVL